MEVAEPPCAFGTRYTGSIGHSSYVDWLSEHLAAMPEFTLKGDRLTFNRWLARDYSLSITMPTAANHCPVPVTYYYPYSGKTSDVGVTGKLVDLGSYPPVAPGPSGTGYTPGFWARARGAIAVVRAAPSTFSLTTGQIATGGYEPGKTSARPPPTTRRMPPPP